ncbi:PLP-dependent aminotransferase family protein [Tepidamorphus sp. 3E244]|uniref:aminotransferase-like domain-containing protein n=1 Tax=Tepidamorphus sp. 3E244 TaxID=3385498 RepID=UPI0038FCED57
MAGETAERTLISDVMASVRQRIAGRSLAAGAKLPSIRQMAARMEVSTSTVVEAYERLVAEGLVHSRPGSGFYVANQAAPMELSDVGPRLDRAVDPLWVSRQSLDAGDKMLRPGCGWLPPESLPHDALRKALRKLSRAGDAALTEYGSPLGLAPLRQLISQRLDAKGVEVPADQVILTESGTQSIDLLCRFLLDPGDTVLLDDPCYFNFQALLKAHRVKVVSVPYTANGPDLERFAETLAAHRPRLYITNSAIHNPTGAVLSPVVAHRVLKLAEQFATTIVEDDIFADFEHTPAPRLAAFDGFERVIQIGSFSKTLSASGRCGFIAVRPDWVDGLVDLKIATSFGSGRMGSEIVLAVLTDGGYRKHVTALRDDLSRAMRDCATRLKEIGIEPWLMPDAGMFLWCRLPDGLEASDVARKALAEDVVLAPGNAFSVAQTAGNFMRFNVAQCPPRVFEVLRRIIG